MRLWRIGSILILIAWCCGGVQLATAQQVATAPVIIEVKPVVFPEYESYQGISRYAPTPEAYAQAIADPGFVMERLTYRSDDLDVYAFLYRPIVPRKEEKLPVVIFNRGSYVRDDFSPEVLLPGNRLARQGYVVVAPMFRGSGGAQGHDEMGGADLHDLFNIIPVLKELAYVDSERVFLYGESRGGIMCLLAAKHGFPARAIAIYGTITDLSLMIGEGRKGRPMAQAIWPDFASNEVEIIESRSALRWPDKINIPVLIMNGGDDGDVSSINALQLAVALEELGKAYELKIFYGEKHVLAGRAVERDEDAVQWFRRFDVQPFGPTKQ